MKETTIKNMDDLYIDFLSDESRLTGDAETISFPESEQDVVQIVREVGAGGTPITAQGSRTGITGAAVPVCGHIMSFSRMTGITDFDEARHVITVEPGLPLLDLKKELARLTTSRPVFWPPDPTEESASIGGIVSCNSGGITGVHYGPTTDYVQALRLVGSGGEVLVLDRDRGHDERIDSIVGGEGMYGVITQLTLRLVDKPPVVWGISFFFDETENATAFGDCLKERPRKKPHAFIAAAEYLDRRSIDLVEARKDVATTLQRLPDTKADATAMVYMEIHGFDEDAVEEIAAGLLELSEEQGADADAGWALSSESEVELMRAFRHAVPESCNIRIDAARGGAVGGKAAGITKLATDITAGSYKFSDLVRTYEKAAAETKLDVCLFGHILSGHLHMNVLPSGWADYRAGLQLIENITRLFSSAGAQIVSEHGVGKIKKELFAKYADRDTVQEMTRAKARFDEDRIFNPGNMIDE